MLLSGRAKWMARERLTVIAAIFVILQDPTIGFISGNDLLPFRGKASDGEIRMT